MIKRMCAMVLALMLICGTVLADWYCEKCGNINPDEAAKCTIKGCGEPAPIHGLKAEAVSPYAVRLSWYGSTVKLLKILYSPAPGGDWIVAQEGVHGNEYTVEGLAPDTCYYFTLNMTSGDAGDPGISLPYEMAVTAALEPKDDTEPKDTEPKDGAAPEAAPTQEPAPAPAAATQQPVRTGEVQRGDYVVFDAQDSADWLVLEAEADYLLLLSMHVIGLEAKHELAMRQAEDELATLPGKLDMFELTSDVYIQYADLLGQVSMSMPWQLDDDWIVAGDRLTHCTKAGVRPVIRVRADTQMRILEEGHPVDILADLYRDGHLFHWKFLDEASSSDAVEAVYICIDCGEIVCQVYDYWAVSPVPTPRLAPAPAAEPTPSPTSKPTRGPTAKPTRAPTRKPTQAPTAQPTEAPAQPTEAPPKPTEVPPKPTEVPPKPTEAPPKPTEAPPKPTQAPPAPPPPTQGSSGSASN